MGDQLQILTPALAGAATLGPLLTYMRKVIPKFQLRENLGAKVGIGRPVSQKLRSAAHSVLQKFQAAKHNFLLQLWLVLKLQDPLPIYVRKVILKFQFQESLGAKVEIGGPVSQKLRLAAQSHRSFGRPDTTFDSSVGWG
jgi:hypothetical protein